MHKRTPATCMMTEFVMLIRITCALECVSSSISKPIVSASFPCASRMMRVPLMPLATLRTRTAELMAECGHIQEQQTDVPRPASSNCSVQSVPCNTLTPIAAACTAAMAEACGLGHCKSKAVLAHT